MKRNMKTYLILLTMFCCCFIFGLDKAGAVGTNRVSVSSGGVQGNDGSYCASTNSNSRYVAYDSAASNLVAGDTNGVVDIFVRDRQLMTTTRVSINNFGGEGDIGSFCPSISADGRYVAFESDATNLVPDDIGNESDIFVHDRWLGETTRVSVNSGGGEGDGISFMASISGNGRYVAFVSAATNLVTGDTNGTSDIFVHDQDTGITTRVSVSSSGAQADGGSENPSVSSDGRYVAFHSFATNLVTGDTNGMADVFVRDLQTGTTYLVSRNNAGVQGNASSGYPSISADGLYVAFSSGATNLVSGDTNGMNDIFVRDRQTGTTSRVSVNSAGVEGNGASWTASISFNGRFVAFDSSSSNLVAGDTNSLEDIFLRDRWSGTTSRMSLSGGGAQANYDSWFPFISSNGRFVAFESFATNLVSGDTNMRSDIFLRDWPSNLCNAAIPTMTGTTGNDTLIGTSAMDVIQGLEGDDTIYGLGGNDIICGSAGLDDLYGDDGMDSLFGGADFDYISGGNGNDTIDGAGGNDILSGDAGNDSLTGGADDDILDGGADTDTCKGGIHVSGDTAINCETVGGIP